MHTGIEIKSNGIEVPEYEVREAARFAGYPYIQFVGLPWYERAATVAQYRAYNQIESHAYDASRKASERRSQKHGK